MRHISRLAHRAACCIALTAAALVGPPATLAQTPPAFSDAFDAASPGRPAPDWFVPTPTHVAEVIAAGDADGGRALRLAPADPAAPPAFGNVMRVLPAGPFADRRVILRAKVRVQGNSNARAQMWLRVDRRGGQPGAFDNMNDRPIRNPAWTDATIEADIDPDATSINIGFMSLGGGTVFIDSVSLAITGDPAPRQAPTGAASLTPRAIENLAAAAHLLAYVRFFVASDQAVGVASWDHVYVDIIEQAEAARDPSSLARILQDSLRPLAPTLQVWAGAPADAPPPPPIPDVSKPTAVAFWKHHGAGSATAARAGNVYASRVERSAIPDLIDSGQHEGHFRIKALPGGVSCRIPVRVYADDAGTIPPGPTPKPWSKDQPRPTLTAMNRSTRLAGVAIAWGIFQHFYPYFDVVQTDWEAALRDALARASQAPDQLAYLGVLRELVAGLHDGHGNVLGPEINAASYFPLALEWAGEDLVVVGVPPGDAAASVHVGDAVVSIDDRPVAECYRDVSAWVSAATEGWRRAASIQRFLLDLPTRDPVALALRRSDGSNHHAVIARAGAPTPNSATARRPDAGVELAPGIVYFDLNGADSASLAAVADKLAAAKGIVFDLRGYPNQAAYEVIQHLIDAPVQSARWNIPVITLPDREDVQWNQSGRWNVTPTAPRWNVPVAFLTDGRAISYAESIMGIVEHYHLGEIIGAATAGTNGNVNPIAIPGGYRITWTGMKVLKHDGSQHHGIGIAPTVPVTPTAAGIAQGRDEVLARAVEVLQQKINQK
ncbi:MAG: S41 family peptidase [Phycisphaerales bacterium]